MARIRLTELREEDLPFLLNLWQIAEVMRYADEFPGQRGWTKDEEPETAWRIYQEQRARHGPAYTQLIVRLADERSTARSVASTAIGEAFVAPLPEAYTFGKWRKPDGVPTVMGDIKLLPQYWGRGLGTKAMCQVVAWVFENTTVHHFVVPPHRRNPAAGRIYEKAGFRWFPGTLSRRSHRIMALSREQFMASKNRDLQNGS